MAEKRATQHSIELKKYHGQHFLRASWVVEEMLDHVHLHNQSSVFEIGCGDGFLTSAILKQDIARLWVFEIDEDWATYVRDTYADERMTMHHTNFLDVDFSILKPHQPWTVLANLPYNVTFPILHVLQRYRRFLAEGVLMMQEEVAQKILKTSGRGYGYPSLFFQHYFNWKKLSKIGPQVFYPAPKVHSRLLYFRPKAEVVPIPEEEKFWKFIKICFRQPRRTLRNNLAQSHYQIDQIDEETLALRAQQMSMSDFLHVWDKVR